MEMINRFNIETEQFEVAPVIIKLKSCIKLSPLALKKFCARKDESGVFGFTSFFFLLWLL